MILSIEKKEYENGRKFLAQVMGYDPVHFTPEQVNEAIEYLLPSSLYAKRARPVFKVKIRLSNFQKIVGTTPSVSTAKALVISLLMTLV